MVTFFSQLYGPYVYKQKYFMYICSFDLQERANDFVQMGESTLELTWSLFLEDSCRVFNNHIYFYKLIIK